VNKADGFMNEQEASIR